MRRVLLFRSLAVVVALGAAFLLAEIALRTIPSSGSRYQVAPTVDRWSEMSYGFNRTRLPRVRPKPSGAFRVATIGDSFTFGGGVYAEDSFAVKVVRRLAARSPEVEFDLLNWSSPGWNTYREVWTFKRSVEILDPDLAILGFVLNDTEPLNEEQLAPLREILGPLAAGSPTATVAGSLVLGRLRTSTLNLRSRRLLNRYYHSLFEYEPGWTAAKQSLRSLRRTASERSFPLLVVIFPIFDSQFDQHYPYKDLHDLVRTAVEGMGIDVLDLLPYYKGVDARRLAVEPFADPHPNELAHRIAADAIADYLVEHETLAEALRK